MPLNLGYVELGGGGVTVRVYYDAEAPHDTPEQAAAQPLINGPRGWCLDVSNVSGARARITIRNPGGTVLVNTTIGEGDPVTSGAARSRTATQMAQLGYTVRGDVSGLTLAGE